MASEEYLTRLHDAGSAPALASVPPGVACIVTCRPTCAINTPTRYRLLIMCFVASVLNYSDRQNIAYAIVNMAPDLGWTEAQKGWVLSSFMIGYLFSNIPAGWLANRFGGRFAMLLGAFLWSSFTVLTPVAARFSFGLLIACRIGLGFSEGVCWPAAHALLNKWFPAGERSRAVAWFTSGAHIGNILTIIVAPPLVVGAGWPWAFYLFGGLGFVFLAGWVWVVHEEPAEHPTLSDTELHYIRSGASSDGDNDKRAASFAMVDSVSPLERVAASPRAIPWRLFFTSRQLWGMYLNFFASGFGMFVLSAWMPTYFNETFDVPLKEVGAYTIGPYICQAIGMVIAGAASKALIERGILSAPTCCTVMQMIALAGPIAFFALLIALPVASVGAGGASAILAAGLGLSSFSVPGAQSYAQVVVPRYAALLFAIANSFGVLPGAIGIFVAGEIKEKLHSFSLVFVIAIVCYAMGIVSWLALVRGRPEALDAHEQHEYAQATDESASAGLR